jgi:hypothetical protein
MTVCLYPSEATSHAELVYRIRASDDRDHRGRTPFV